MILMLAASAFAVPMELNHQGRLFDAAGLPLDGPHDVTFRLFANASGGASLWAEPQTVQFDNGYFSAQLGNATTLDDGVLDGSALWIELEIDTTVLPTRQKVVSVPYAVRANTAANVDGGVVDASEIRIGGNTVIDGSGNWQGTGGDGDTLAELTCSADQVAVFSGSSWGCANQAGGTIAWADITSIPLDFADGTDDDTLGGIACTNPRDLLVWDDAFGAWGCANQALSFAIDLAAGTTIDGNAIADRPGSDSAYIDDEAGEIDSAADFGFASATAVANLDADMLDGSHKADLDAQYLDDDAGQIDTAADFGFASSTSIPNLDADTVDGANKSDLDSQYLDDNAGEIDAASDFGFTGPTAIANLDADLLDGAEKTDLDSQYIDNDAGEIDSAADFSFASATAVPNLDADLLDGFDKSDLDVAYVDVVGDVMTGNLSIQSTNARLELNGAGDSGVEWAVQSTGETFEILEPEDSAGKVHLRINDGGDVELLPDGNAAFRAQSNGNTTTTGDSVVGGNVRSGNLGLYCGKTANTYTGSQVGGYNGARDKCVTACGDSRAHMCTIHEYVMSRSYGLTISAGGGWVSGMYNSGGSTNGDDDCDQWAANGEYGGVWGWTGSSQDLNWSACSTSWAVACCM